MYSNIWRFGINIYEKRIVHQIGHLQELYQDVGQQHIKKLSNDFYCVQDTKGLITLTVPNLIKLS
jgi:hypothetical protein